MKRVVLGESDAHGGYAVGPVYLDTAVDELRDLIEDRGDICRGVVLLEPAGEFRTETRRRLARGVPAPVVAAVEQDEEISAEGDAFLDLLAQERAEDTDEPIPFDPGTGPIPGYVAGRCGHRVAESEWRAGFRTCERCPADDEPECGDA